MRNTVIAVNAVNSQGSASATTAAIKTGNAVACVEVCASTQTISPDVFASAARIAFVMRSWSSFEMFITSFPKRHHRPKTHLHRKTRRLPRIPRRPNNHRRNTRHRRIGRN